MTATDVSLPKGALSETRTVLSADGTTIAFESGGTGPALVIVDGALCTRQFGPARPLARALSSRFTVTIYDRRGRGESSNTEPYSVAKEVEDLTAVVRAAGNDVFLFGQSSGGALALEAVAAGMPVRKLAVYEAPYIGLDASVNHLNALQSHLAAGNPGKAVDHFMVKMVGAPAFVPFMVRLNPKVWRQLTATAPTLPNDTMVMDGFEVPTSRLGAISCSTLVLGGGKGASNMKGAVQAVAAAIAGSRLKFLPGQTHQVSEKTIAPELSQFFLSDEYSR